MRWIIIGFNYIVEAFEIVIVPYIATSLIIHIMNEKRIVKWKHKHILLFVYIVYMVAVMLITGIGRIEQYQFDFSALSYQLVLFRDVEIPTMLLNLIMFLPFGLLSPLVWHNFFHSWKTAAAVGCISSVLIEVIQSLFLGRLGDVNDVVMNTIGCVIGYGVYKRIDFNKLTSLLRRFWPWLLFTTCIPISGVCFADMIAWHVGVKMKYIGSAYIKLTVILITILLALAEKLVHKYARKQNQP